MRIKKFRNKSFGAKGQTDIFLDSLSYILFVVIIILFFIIFHVIKGCNNPAVERISSSDESRQEYDLFFLNLLRTNNLQGEEGEYASIPLSDLILLYYESRDEKYEEIIESRLDLIFRRYAPIDPDENRKFNCYNLIGTAKGRYFMQISPICCPSIAANAYEVSLVLPAPMNKDEFVLDLKLSLYWSDTCDNYNLFMDYEKGNIK